MFERRRARILLTVLALISLVLLTVSARAGDEGPLASIRDGIATVFSPVQDGLATVTRPVGDFFGGIGDLFSLRRENARLEARVEELEVRRRSAQDIRNENERLRELLGMRRNLSADSDVYEFLPTHVIALAGSNYEWTVTVDAGSDDGISKSMTVVNGDGLVGRIIQVGPTWSRVLLAVDPNFSAAVRVVRTGEYGYLAGGDTEPMRLQLFDPEADVEAGDEVVTSTYRNAVFPDGIPIGVVDSVGEATGSLSREVLVRPFVDFTRLQTVLVILRQPPPEPVELPSPGLGDSPEGRQTPGTGQDGEPVLPTPSPTG